ncbi:hypothetical protein ZWY2020_059191 [Hordeum vulgare]|nr:hypothetical protein ZWY2020_059191 [Hordeum vulgare]
MMCSTHKSLCYLGGETRIVVVERNASLADVHGRLSRSLLEGQPFTLKYHLPNEDLGSLISVSTNVDLDNLVDKYNCISAASSGAGAGGSSSRTSQIRHIEFIFFYSVTGGTVVDDKDKEKKRDEANAVGSEDVDPELMKEADDDVDDDNDDEIVNVELSSGCTAPKAGRLHDPEQPLTELAKEAEVAMVFGLDPSVVRSADHALVLVLALEGRHAVVITRQPTPEVDGLVPAKPGGSWDEHFPSFAATAAAGGWLCLMCSFRGRIMALSLPPRGAALHAQVPPPQEDLDSLISVFTNKDLDNLVDEYDRTAAASSGAGNGAAPPGYGI